MKTTTFMNPITGFRADRLLVAAMIALGVMLASCSNTATQGAADATAAEAEADETGVISFTEDDIKAIKAKFIVDESGWYNHTLWGKSLVPRRTLTALVNGTGYFVLSSNYYADKPLQHTHIKVKIGEEEVESNKLDLKSTDHAVQTVAGKTYEVNTYSRYGDNGIFQKIADSPRNTEVQVTFQAKNARVEEKISKADIDAIRDCSQLSLVLRMEQAQQAQ